MAQEETIVSGMAGRYASALFALAREKGVTDAVATDLAQFTAMTEESAELRQFVRSPVFSADVQIKAIGALLEKAEISGISANFLKLVAQKRRLFAIGDMIRDYAKLNDQFKGVTRAEVTLAEPLADKHRAAIEEALKDVTGGRSVDVSVKIDPSIIGGLIVKLGSRMVDASLKTKLNSIRTQMKEVG